MPPKKTNVARFFCGATGGIKPSSVLDQRLPLALSKVTKQPMRPSVLHPLFVPVDTLSGLGIRLAPLYKRLVAGGNVVDALWHLPNGVIDRRLSGKIAEALCGRIATLVVQVEAHVPPAGIGRAPYRVRCADESGFITLTFFNPRRDYLMRQFPIGETVVISGKVEEFNGERQMPHPDYVVSADRRTEVDGIEPQYPLTAGITQKTASRAAAAALAAAPDLPEWLDPTVLQQRQWPGWKEALTAVHRPQDEGDLSALSPLRQRLAYDELLANQLALLLVRASSRAHQGRSLQGDGRLRQAAAACLPFALTEAQTRALEDIYQDMASPDCMLRLLQGDVGSGKTVVAFMAALNAIECGAQAAIMAPTEILARQHWETLAPLAEKIGVRLGVLTGRDKGKGRTALLKQLAAGEIDLLVGTHSLFQSTVEYADLALAIIDEQHRFGVHQRLGLASKGRLADMLVMTATPIPRTLTLTHYGDMDVSRLDQKPPGRKPIATRALPLSRLEDIVAAIQRALAQGNKVYWVCPLVEDSEVINRTAAEERFAFLQEALGELGSRVGLVHGKMKSQEKDAVMAAFSGSELDVLVATTVIEVGVNVPSATVMVIEHAECFGLAQLHQLRGRIGRGDRASTCLLLYAPPLGATSKARLEIMRQSEDGFLIAEEDLRLRGGGEILGTRQSGLPEFRLADIAVHGDLLALARNDAALILTLDPHLESERGQALRVLLHLFEREAAIETLRSG